LGGKKYDPGDVTARPVEACHETLLDRIDASGEDDRDGRSRCLRRLHCRFAAGRRNDGNRPPHEFRRHRRQPIVLADRKVILDGHVPTLDVAAFRQPVLEGRDQMRCVIARPGAEIADYRHRRLLRPCR
jgi:hypothetical protein